MEDNKAKAIIFMLLSALSFSLMAAMVKSASDLPVAERVLFRNFVSLIIAFIALKKTKVPAFGNPKNRKYLLLRSFFGLSGVMFYFYSIDGLYLADSSMLNKLSPFFVTLFAAIFLQEQVRKIQIPSLIIAFLASLLIIKPQFDMSILPAFAGFMSALFAGSAYTVVRYLGDKEHPSTIVFFFSLVSVLGMLPIVALNYKIPNFEETLFLLGTGIFAAGGQFGLTYAYKYAKASELAVYNYSNIIFAAIVGYLVWNEISDIYSIIGGSMIIVVSTFLYLYDRSKIIKAKLKLNDER